MDDFATTPEDTRVNVDVFSNDDQGDAPATITEVTDPPNGTAVISDNGTPSDPTDDTIVYTTDPDYFGLDSFGYTIADTDGDISSATVSITVTPVDDYPVANNDGADVLEDSVLTASVADNDIPSGDGDNIWSRLTGPSNGDLDFNDDGSYIYDSRSP